MPIRDTRMMAKALEQRWPISETARKAIVGRLLSIVADPTSSPREVTAAAKALMAADTVNVSSERNETEENEDRRLRLIELARRVPIGDLARLASDNGIIVDGQSTPVVTGRTDEPTGVDGKEAGSGTRPKDPPAEERRETNGDAGKP